MTIKKRLFLSNILMIVIPAFLSVITLAAGLLILFSAALPDSGYRLLNQHELAETRCELVEIATDWISETNLSNQSDLAQQLVQTVTQNQMYLVISHNGTEVQRFGDNTIPVQEQLSKSLEALGETGTVSDGAYDLFVNQISVGDNTYQIKIYNPVISVENQSIKAFAVVFVFLAGVTVLLVIFLTNRFLIRFVWGKISEPLQILAEGVHQIRDGNLTHRIFYANRDEFQPVCEDFNEMAQRLRASVEQSQKEEESRKELLASISHDIRSPLTAIRAYVEGLLDGVADTPEKKKNYLSTIQKKTIEIDQMVSMLFLFSKMDMGEYPYNPEKLNVSKEISDFIFASSDEYLRRGLKIQLKSMPKNVIIEADPTYFRSILMNLTDNSAKYKKKDTGTVSITGELSGQFLLLYVDDDGPGVPAEALSKLFNVFYRNDPSRKNPNQGSGLGLAIVSKTIERMGGSIHAENLPEGGLRIVLKIPLAEREKENEEDSDY